MLDFDRSIARLGAPLESDAAAHVARATHIAELEHHGVDYEMDDGSFTAECCVCGKTNDLPGDVMESDVNYQHHCGASPSC